MPSLRRKSPSRAKKKLVSFFNIAALIIVGLALLVSSYFIKQSFDNRQQASSQPTATVTWQSRDVTTSSMKMALMLNTKGYTLAGVQVVGKITGVKKEDVSYLTVDGFPAEIVFERVSDVSDGVKFSFTKFAYLDAQKPLTTRGGEQAMAILQIKKRSNQNITFSIDQTSSSLPNITDSKSYVSWPNTQSVNFASSTSNNSNQDRDKKSCNQNCATDTECQSIYRCYKGQCRLPKEPEREDATCRQTADNGLKRSCNQYCADKNECAAGFDCYYNRCRNPKNLTSENCTEPKKAQPVVTPTATTKPTTPPKGSVTSKVIITNISPTPSASATPLPSAYASSQPSPSIRAYASPTPTPRATTKPTPSPSVVTNAKNTNSGPGFLQVIVIVVALIVLGGVGFALWRSFAKR